MTGIVIVEDELLVRKGIIMSIDWASLGCEVVGSAKDGVEGIEVITKMKPDIVISDIRMPKLSGIDMIRNLKESGVNCSYIILTAYSDFSYAQNALNLGASAYILKPFRDGELEDAIKATIASNKNKKDHKEIPVVNQFDTTEYNNPYIEKAIIYIMENYNKSITIGDVSQCIGLTEGYFSRFFKEKTNYTVINYLVNYRMYMAKQLLKDCTIKVYEVSFLVGYQDPTYFSSLFKKTVGMTPAQYQSGKE